MTTPTGVVQRFLWSYQTETWQLFLSGLVDQCDNYAFYGANSECNVNNSPQCEGLTGYTPKSPEKWNSLDRIDGCVRKVNLDCDNRDGFLKYTVMKLPDTSSSWFDKNMTLQECEIQCLKNCSCIAYSNLDIRYGGRGCMIWFNNIMDMRKENSEGQEIHIRVAASELDSSKNNLNKKKLAGILGVGTLILGITIAGYVMYLKRKKLRKSCEFSDILF
ncbi:G-type lectin S-receptor-like serine/threonine-protein kinase At4g27290 [Gastrolobium bilobum]|uniref:G-type lectin S-receptor-like serine/threonine-protein kinase At4g27290 n=1 Tax=Gastrolobium bilobum TaxID=150636 RepID=UPI002AB005AA|nr:G-type lectin S-receptor-like serine/threonine-protein kinase At4g27290 [Gastrolobium bilobum]